MTTRIGSAITGKVLTRMTGPRGVNAELAALSQADRGLAPFLDAAQIRGQNVTAELAERGGELRFPAVSVYCEKVVNNLTEKFRRFSGPVRMAVEIRHSQDRLEQLQERLEIYADAVAQSLTATRGDWGDGAYYAGQYEVSFSPVKRGGRNFMQSAKITFEITVSRS